MRKQEPTQIIFEHLDEKTEFYKWLNEESIDDGVKRARMLLQQSQSLNKNIVSSRSLTDLEPNSIEEIIRKRKERDNRRRREIISNRGLKGVKRCTILPVGRAVRGSNLYNKSTVDNNGVELVTTVDGVQVVVVKKRKPKQTKGKRR